MKSYAFLFWAYNVVWIGLAIYVLVLLGRTGKLDRRLEALERRLGPAARSDQESSASSSPRST